MDIRKRLAEIIDQGVNRPWSRPELIELCKDALCEIRRLELPEPQEDNELRGLRLRVEELESVAASVREIAETLSKGYRNGWNRKRS